MHPNFQVFPNIFVPMTSHLFGPRRRLPQAAKRLMGWQQRAGTSVRAIFWASDGDDDDDDDDDDG